MKRVMFDLQLSSFDVDGKLKIESDSNYQFLKGLLEAIRSEFEPIILLPNSLTYPQVEKLFGGVSGNGTTICLVEYGDDYYSARFKLDWGGVCKGIANTKPDLIWTNNPMWVHFYRAALRKLKMDIPVVCYNHWIDLPSTPKEQGKYSLAMLQAAGMLNADMTMANSIWGLKLIRDGVSQMGLETIDVRKAFAFPPPIRSGYHSGEVFGYCVYNHRISSHPYYRDALERMRTLMSGLGMEVVFTNPSGKEPITDFDFPYRYVSLNWDGYMDLLSHAYCSVSTLIDAGAQWSMSLAESLACGVPTLIPRKYGYAEMLPADYPLYYDDMSEAKKKILGLMKNRPDVKKYSKHVTECYGAEASLSRMRELFARLEKG